MDPTTYTGKHPLTADIDQMPDTPYRGFHHRRAHSDTTFRFDDLLLFDPSDLDLASLDLPTPTPPRGVPMNVDSSDDSTCKPPKPNHLRSLSVDSDFFDGFDAVEEKFGGKGVGGGGGVGEKRGNHRHSNSIDGSTATSFDAESGLLFDSGKKATDADRLAELALIDPKRAKRILANRQSAARSKERKVRYTNELERKVQTLQSEATTLSAQVTVLQRDTTGLTTENKELKLRLQALEQQAHLRDALNEALREEVQRLRIAAGQVPAANGNLYNQPAPPQFASNQPALQQFGGIQQNHQYQQQQQQLQVSQSSVNNQVHPHASFSNYGQKV